MASSAPVTRLDLAALVAAKAEKQLVDEAKSSPNFIPLHLKEVQDEPVPAEGESVVVTPRSRSNSTASARGTPHLDSPSSFASNCSPRVAASGSSANVDRLNTCSECGRVDHAHIQGACSWRCMVKTRIRGKDEAFSPTDSTCPLAPSA